MEDDPVVRIAREFIAKFESTDQSTNGYRDEIVDWAHLAESTFELEWLVDGIWPNGKHLAIFATHKTGKSLLSLHIATSIAMGIDAFTREPIEPRDVLYIDKEMAEADLQERMFDMGHFHAMKAGEPKRLHYAIHPVVPPMDTMEGGIRLLEMAQRYECSVVVIDTLSRVVKGDEQSNDTYKAFFNYTGSLLKANGIAMLRLDHEGHQKGHMRGASSKGDDIDIAFQLKAIDGGLELSRTLSRVSYVKETVRLVLTDEPLGFKTTDARVSYMVGTPERANELRELGVPIELSVRSVQRWLRERGHQPGNTKLLTSALKYRKTRETIDDFLK